MARRRRGIVIPPEDSGMSEINITPLTDVLLVLLIIFLVTATAATQNAFNMNLPKGTSPVTVKAGADYVVVSVSARNGIFIQEETSAVANPRKELARRLALYKEKMGTDKVAIRADGKASYGSVILVMDAAKQAGLHKINLVAE
jgi:biopolymer transport protein ExbD